ncbi:MAG: J domain-containing protein [Thermodesulfobacteriota bacterium]
MLGVDRGQGFEEIRRRYKEKLLQYHPDRVLHLGKEFQEIAERKTKEITEAFQKILRERKDRS